MTTRHQTAANYSLTLQLTDWSIYSNVCVTLFDYSLTLASFNIWWFNLRIKTDKSSVHLLFSNIIWNQMEDSDWLIDEGANIRVSLQNNGAPAALFDALGRLWHIHTVRLLSYTSSDIHSLLKGSVATIQRFLVRLHFTFSVEGVVEISQNKAFLFFTHSAFTNKSVLQRINAIWLHHSCSITQFCVQCVTCYQSWWKLLANFLSTWQLEEFYIFLWQTGPILPTHTFISSYIKFSKELSAGSVIRQEICLNLTW